MARMEWLADHSVVQFIGLSKRRASSNCGYCKTSDADSEELDNDDIPEDPNEKKSVCLGAWGIRMTADEYAKSIDIGWRRSGRYLYKPIMEETCCPLYTIRLDSLNFKLSRSQKRVIRVWNEFLKFDKKVPVRGNVCKHEHQPETTTHIRKKKKLGPTPPVPGKNRERKKKTIRRNKCFEKLKSQNINIEEYQEERKQKEQARKRPLEDYFWTYDETFKHKLELRLVRVGSPEFNESVDESYQVYVKYQQTVHQDKRCTRRGFQSFLVDTPFIPSDEIPMDGFPRQGTYHAQYLIDGQIVAVGVVDLLSRCLSSAYFFWDPDYAFLNLGTFSALKEIEFVRSLAEHRPECHYYYMGYYVHNCRKMRYKGGFSPSELLCERSHEWVPLPECQEMIEQNDGRFTVFRPNAPEVPPGNVWTCKPLRYHGVTASGTFEKLHMNQELADQLSQFAKYFGDLSSYLYVVV